jgi:hypothetical protein
MTIEVVGGGGGPRSVGETGGARHQRMRSPDEEEDSERRLSGGGRPLGRGSRTPPVQVLSQSDRMGMKLLIRDNIHALKLFGHKM